MDRHPEYKYVLEQIDEKDSWIFIGDKDQSGWGKIVYDMWDSDKDSGPVEFLLRIKERNNWDIEKVGDLQYRFKQDKIGLTFQWDDLFGFVVAIGDWNRRDEAVRFLNDYFVD